MGTWNTLISMWRITAWCPTYYHRVLPIFKLWFMTLKVTKPYGGGEIATFQSLSKKGLGSSPITVLPSQNSRSSDNPAQPLLTILLLSSPVQAATLQGCCEDTKLEEMRWAGRGRWEQEVGWIESWKGVGLAVGTGLQLFILGDCTMKRVKDYCIITLIAEGASLPDVQGWVLEDLSYVSGGPFQSRLGDPWLWLVLTLCWINESQNSNYGGRALYLVCKD